jgi:hypothetical protein
METSNEKKESAAAWVKLESAAARSQVDDACCNKICNDGTKTKTAITVPVILPMEIFPTVLSFCPKSTLLQMRAVNKSFGDDFVRKECLERHEKDYTKREAEWKKNKNYEALSVVDLLWGVNKAQTIAKALAVAKTMFYLGGENDDDGVNDQDVSMLLADGYDESKVKTMLEKDGLAFWQNDDVGRGSAKFWRVEARYKKVTLSEAIREMNVYADTNENDILLLMAAPLGARASIAECEVSIRTRNGGICRGNAFQHFTVEWSNGSFWTIAPAMHCYCE